MTWVEILALAGASAAAGAVNSVAGGGTLLTFPVLLSFGVPPLVANATSTIGLVCGLPASVYGYRRRLPEVAPMIRRFLPVSLAGGVLGAWLLTRTDERAFSACVPWLILFATLLFAGQPLFRRFAGLEREGSPGPHHHTVAGALVFQFLVAVYGGYFGAGIGILMLASFALLGVGDIHRMNALKTVLGGLINVVAALWFVTSGLVDWPRAGVMTVGALFGYYAGARLAQRIPPKPVRLAVIATGLLVSAVMFLKA